MKHEGMPIQRREEKRVEERASAPEREREKEPFGSSFYVFPSLWAYPMQIGLARSVCSPEVLTLVLGSSFVLFSRAFPFLVF